MLNVIRAKFFAHLTAVLAAFKVTEGSYEWTFLELGSNASDHGGAGQRARDLPPDGRSFVMKSAGLVFIFFVVSLGKRAGRGALKLLKRPTRFCGRLISDR